MIDASVATLLHALETTSEDRAHAFEPGYEPINRDLAARSSRTVVDADNPLAVVVPRDAYIAVTGPGGTSYTRNGQLRFEDGALHAANGDAVLGWPPGANVNQPPIPLRADPVDAALGRCREIAVAPDGTLSYARTSVDAKRGKVGVEHVVVGRIALARFPAGTRLERAAADALVPGEGIEPSALAVPNTLGFGELSIHRREVASVDVVKATVRWAEAVQAYQALAQAQGAGIRTALDLVK